MANGTEEPRAGGVAGLLARRRNQISITISVVAFVFSLVTSLFSWMHGRQQEIHDARVELRGLLQRMSVLQRDFAEAQVKYQNDPLALGMLAGSINQENSLVAKQAREIAQKIPKNVSSTEYIDIANGLMGASEMEAALEVAEQGLNKAEENKDLNEKVMALRGLGTMFYQAGNFEEGRKRYSSAEATINAATMNDDTKNYTLAYTYATWANAELMARRCTEAAEHRQRARLFIGRLTESTAKDQISGGVTALDSQMRTMCAAQARGPEPAEPKQ